MKTLVAVARPDEREKLRRTLSARGHEVLASDPAKLSDELLRQLDFAIVQAVQGRAWVGKVRERHPAIPIVAFVPRNGKLIEEALSEGANDFMFGPLSSDALVARLTLAQQQANHAVAESDPLCALAVWEDAPNSLSQEVGEMFGVFFDVEETRGASVPDLAAEIVARAPDEELCFRIMVGMTHAGLDVLGTAVFGGPQPAEVMADCLREVVNCAAGTFKRLAMSEGVTFAISVPEDCPGSDVLGADRQWLARADGMVFHFGVHRGASSVRRVRASALQAGMVLKNDVKTGSGVLLVNSGMALSETTIEKLVRRFGPRTEFEVVE